MHLSTAYRLGQKVVQRSAAEALYIRSGINFTRPSDIRATLTERCNYRCLYCDHWRQSSYADEMSFQEWCLVLDSILDFVGRFSIQFLGGEPTIMPWFFDLARFCQEKGIDWGTITNGSTLSAERATSIASARPLNIDVSIDSLIAEEHDRVRGVSGSLANVKSGIARLVHARERSGHTFLIRIKPTVSRYTISSLTEIVQWAASMPAVKVDFSPVRLWRESQKLELYPQTVAEMKNLSAQIDALINLKHSGAPIETSVEKLHAIVKHFEGLPIQHGVSECRVGLRSIDIRPNGDVNHCGDFKKIGNLRDQSMRAIWSNSLRRELVPKMIACQKFRESCSTACVSHRSLAQEVTRGLAMIRSTRMPSALSRGS